MPTYFEVTPQLTGSRTEGYDCSGAAGAAQVATATDGRVRPTAVQVRNLTPRAGMLRGLTIGMTALAIREGWGVPSRVHEGVPLRFAELRELLRDPRLIAHVAMQYGVLQGTRFDASRSGFSGAHSGCLHEGLATDVGWADPLADGRPGVYRGPVRIPWPLIERACGYVRFRSGRQLGVGWVVCSIVERQNTAEPPPLEEGDEVRHIMMSGYPADSLPTIPIPAGTPIEDLVGNRWGTIKRATSARVVGLADGSARRRVVIVSTARYYPDGVARPTGQVVVLE